MFKRISIAGAVLTASGLMSYYLPPSVIPPTPVSTENPFLLVYELKNENILPIVGLEFDCTLQRGSGPANNQEPPERYDDSDDTTPGPYRDHVTLLQGKDAVSGRCDLPLPPERTLPFPEYVIFLRYWSPPVPFRRTAAFVFVPVRDSSGKITKCISK